MRIVEHLAANVQYQGPVALDQLRKGCLSLRTIGAQEPFEKLAI
jgi:hypothetical protein